MLSFDPEDQMISEAADDIVAKLALYLESDAFDDAMMDLVTDCCDAELLLDDMTDDALQTLEATKDAIQAVLMKHVLLKTTQLILMGDYR